MLSKATAILSESFTFLPPLKKGVDYTCPSCGKKIKISNGKNKCKYCKAEIDFKGKV